jgi:cell division protein FtsQ
MPRVTQKLLPPPLPDRPGKWRMLWRRQRRLLRPAVLVGAVMLMLVAGIGFLAAVGRAAPLRAMIDRTTADLGLQVRNIQIRGSQKTTEAQIRKALGVNEGDSILGFSLAGARQRIEALTWVQSATIARRLPGDIFISVVERSPFAVWQNQGKFMLIDRSGAIVADQDIAVFAKELPLVVGAGAPAAAAALIDALAAQPTLQSRVVAAVRVGERRWNLRLSNGTDVMLPEGAEIPAIARLVELQNDHALLDRPMQAVDLRLPDRLVLRPRNEAAPPPATPGTAPGSTKKPT